MWNYSNFYSALISLSCTGKSMLSLGFWAWGGPAISSSCGLSLSTVADLDQPDPTFCHKLVKFFRYISIVFAGIVFSYQHEILFVNQHVKFKKLIFHGNWSDQDPIPRWMMFWSRTGYMIRKQTDPDSQHCLYQYGVSYCHAMSVSLLPCGIWSPGIFFGKFLASLLFLISQDFNSVKNIFYEALQCWVRGVSAI